MLFPVDKKLAKAKVNCMHGHKQGGRINIMKANRIVYLLLGSRGWSCFQPFPNSKNGVVRQPTSKGSLFTIQSVLKSIKAVKALNGVHDACPNRVPLFVRSHLLVSVLLGAVVPADSHEDTCSSSSNQNCTRSKSVVSQSFDSFNIVLVGAASN